ncbi:MAG TPA: hypothetical protein PLQ76_07530, partial [bacterium]|nr:hypothetical protein [bacterium]
MKKKKYIPILLVLGMTIFTLSALAQISDKGNGLSNERSAIEDKIREVTPESWPPDLKAVILEPDIP